MLGLPLGLMNTLEQNTNEQLEKEIRTIPPLMYIPEEQRKMLINESQIICKLANSWIIDIKDNKQHYCKEKVYIDIICATTDCPRNADCKRYAAYLYLIENDIMGETCTLFPHENCPQFIPMEKNQ